MNQEDFNYLTLSSKRGEWMGIAIIMVLLFHLSGKSPIANYMGWANHWYFGVDIFLVLSGFGLCYSYKKNTLTTFWWHRVKRVMPLYIIQLLIRYFVMGTDCSPMTIISEVTTLSMWNVGDGWINWYVDAIMFFYLIFPLLYKCVKKSPLLTLFLAFSLSVFILHFFSLRWEQCCMVGRFPIFIVGVIIALSKNKSNVYYALLVCLTFWNILLVISCHHFWIPQLFVLLSSCLRVLYY